MKPRFIRAHIGGHLYAFRCEGAKIGDLVEIMDGPEPYILESPFVRVEKLGRGWHLFNIHTARLMTK